MHYQGALERKFLDLVSKLKFIDKLTKAKPFFYEFEKKSHLYHCDFLYNNALFEMKSNWTYDNNGKKLKLRKKNHLKWISAISQGYKLYVIWDHTWISFFNKTNDFDDINKNLYSKDTPFTKELLIDIFKQL